MKKKKEVREASDRYYDEVINMIEHPEKDTVLVFSKVIKKHTAKIHNNEGFDVLEASKDELNWLQIKGEEFKKHINALLEKGNTTHSKFGHYLQQEFTKFALESVSGGMGSGYPDAQIPQSVFNRIPYVECKAANEKDMEGNLRTFYYKAGGRISRSTSHLLIGFEFASKKGKRQVTKVHVIDCKNLHVRLRPELYASNKEVYATK